MVMVQHDSSADPEREDWLRLSQQRLADAYGDDEPDYPLSLIKEPNPDRSARSPRNATGVSYGRSATI
jgi:hypothetical protein